MTAAVSVLRRNLALFLVIAIAAGFLATLLTAARAAAFNVDAKGLLLRGYDPVAYFATGAPVKGDPKLTASHNGVTVYFASAANREVFAKEPDKYLPAYGGFCAYGVASGAKVDGDPTVWKIVDGRLYLNINKSIGRTFAADPATYIRRAEQNWPKLKNK
jgi:YHS domain-containing protein